MSFLNELEVGKLKVAEIQRSGSGLTSWGFFEAGSIANNGTNTTTTASDKAYRPMFPAFVSMSVNGATVKYVLKASADIYGLFTVTTSAAQVAGDVFNYAFLSQGANPAWDIFAAGTSTVPNTTTNHDITVTGVSTNDLVLATRRVVAGTARTINTIKYQSANTVRAVLSGATDAVGNILDYVVLRPAGSFVPSHKIIAAGVATLVGGGTSEDITVTGARSNDQVLVTVATNGSSNLLTRALPGTDKITLTFAGDPVSGTVAYAVLRAAV